MCPIAIPKKMSDFNFVMFIQSEEGRCFEEVTEAT